MAPSGASKASWLGNLGSVALSNAHALEIDEEDALLGTTSSGRASRPKLTCMRTDSKLTKAVDVNLLAAALGRKRAGFAGIWQQVLTEMNCFFLGTKFNILLLVIPFAAISKMAEWGDGPTCALSMIALIPLAERLGYVTDELSSYTNDSIGGLLNASFGNATEVIISWFAIQKGLLRVVQLSLLGSVVSNLLLVMGTAFLAGGIIHPMQRFSKEGISVHCCLLLLAVATVLLPSMLVATNTQAAVNNDNSIVGGGGTATSPPSGQSRGSMVSSSHDDMPRPHSALILSRFESVLMLLCYFLFLMFQLFTHKHLYEGMDEEAPAAPPNGSSSDEVLLVDRSECITSTGSRSNSGRPREGLGAVAGVNEGRTLSGRPLFNMGDAAVSAAASSTGRNSRGEIRGSLEMTTGGITNNEIVLGAGIIASSSRNQAGRRASGYGADVVEMEAGSRSQFNSRQLVDENMQMPAAAGGGGGDDEGPELSMTGCFVWMTLVTAAISVLSEWVVAVIEGASDELHVPLPFLVTILLPIVGNAAEHSSAVMFALRDRIEVALGVAVGSSTQVSVLLVPFCVVVAWALGKPLDLNYSAFESFVFFISVLLAVIVLQEGSSNWLKGVVLLLTYFFVAAGFWCHQDLELTTEQLAAPPAL
ncbi:hypothetical protein CEUSTIGMA_g9029.t1 [Chlamydomonas eustigma]|uniref:Sodium/calcium exchanger membrane region domain-containing protein n=1 Tax=Chlamydomonas eustigma TaxID=1157962 RepID=A0A250XEW4_9CHLO|nr:hypothetical protein CEUSTIGMA_g9029.t1 [Chlamydomonas eustigma]|eukprot:GAX81601.1 hypothetical protein CEUSTIGMA_g9029.t1 [Chlamydomonas eustigma]